MRLIRMIITVGLVSIFSGMGYFLLTEDETLEFSQEHIQTPPQEKLAADMKDAKIAGNTPENTLPRKDIFSYPGQKNVEVMSMHEKKASPISAEAIYTADGWNPAVVKIRKGGTVTFVNASGRNFEPASDPHPVHSAYEGFDAKEPIPTSNSWQFSFERIGLWGYHDHLNPSLVGVIMVE